ncbi:MAG: hypothetical protein CME70_06400 [Halobacteriovorax sp.]|nr:hypothetical protein [Halobacteriovorax sp.]|tara:strand:- start:73 stop:924 length:852 start_codon:yes stop_codon:yes gene_type:complete
MGLGIKAAPFKDGVFSFNGEFSWELVFAIPTAYMLLKEGKLKMTESCGATSPFYYFSPSHKESLARKHSIYMGDNYVDLYRHNLDISKFIYPPFKEKFGGLLESTPGLSSKLLVVNNKSCSEWNGPPRNRIEIDELRLIFEEFLDHDIVYIRPTNNLDFPDPLQGNIQFNDYDLVKKYDNIYTGNDLMKLWNVDFNTMQLMAHSLSEKHISICGGNAIIASYFGGTNIIVDKYLPPNAPRVVPGDMSLRGVWKTDSYLKDINGSRIIGVNNIDELSSALQELK